MFKKPETTINPPPQLIASLRAGFDTVANNVGLILFPILIDIFIWLGPHVSLKSILMPMIKEFETLPGLDSPDMATLLSYSRDVWQSVAEQLNLASVLRTYPVGVPSLMAGILPQQTPMGTPAMMDLRSFAGAFGWWLLFVVSGLVLGSLYFDAVSRALAHEKRSLSLTNIAWDASQAIFLSVAFIILFLAISIPATLLLTVLAMISPAIAQIGVLLISITLVWIMVPLVFSPHGIFVYHQNVITSMLTSVRLVRYTLPGTGLFFLSVIILSQGLDLLWVIPPDTSWLSLVAIGGHAFITTSLLAASFVFYRDGVQWVKETLQRSIASRSTISKLS